MNSDLLFQQHEQYEDLTEHFSEYTNLDLRSNLCKLLQTNLIYSYCESLIVKEVEGDREKIGQILQHHKSGERDLLNKQMPLEMLFELRKIETELETNMMSREGLVGSILNLIVENTLLNSTLSKFACC